MSGQSHEAMQLTPDIHDRRGKLHRQDRLCEQRLRDRESYEATGSTSRTLCPVLLTLCMSQQCQSPQCDVLDRVSEPTCFFCSPIVPPSSRGGQVVKGCKSGVASKYAQNKNNCGPSILEIPLKFRMTPQTGGGGFDKTKTDPTLGCATIGFITTPHKFVSKLLWFLWVWVHCDFQRAQ